MKALFIHRLNSDKDSTTGKIVKRILSDFGIDVVLETFDLLNPASVIEKIDERVSEVDLLIGYSLGGFYVLCKQLSV